MRHPFRWSCGHQLSRSWVFVVAGAPRIGIAAHQGSRAPSTPACSSFFLRGCCSLPSAAHWSLMIPSPRPGAGFGFLWSKEEQGLESEPKAHSAASPRWACRSPASCSLCQWKGRPGDAVPQPRPPRTALPWPAIHPGCRCAAHVSWQS